MFWMLISALSTATVHARRVSDVDRLNLKPVSVHMSYLLRATAVGRAFRLDRSFRLSVLHVHVHVGVRFCISPGGMFDLSVLKSLASIALSNCNGDISCLSDI